MQDVAKNRVSVSSMKDHTFKSSQTRKEFVFRYGGHVCLEARPASLTPTCQTPVPHRLPLAFSDRAVCCANRKGAPKREKAPRTTFRTKYRAWRKGARRAHNATGNNTCQKSKTIHPKECPLCGTLSLQSHLSHLSSRHVDSFTWLQPRSRKGEESNYLQCSRRKT